MGLTNHQLFFVGFAQVLPSWEAWGLPLYHFFLGVSLEVWGMWEVGPKLGGGRWSGEASWLGHTQACEEAWGERILQEAFADLRGQGRACLGGRGGSRTDPHHVLGGGSGGGN